jgi:hypothetical protein
MGRFTDDYFLFPIKVYDGFSLKKAMEEEEKDTTEGPVPIDWVSGWARLPAKDLYKIMWHDGFSRERSVEEVAENGFDLTIIVSDYHGEFVCTWPRKKFEEKLNDFMEKWESSKPSQPMGWISLGSITDSNHLPPQGNGEEKAGE